MSLVVLREEHLYQEQTTIYGGSVNSEECDAKQFLVWNKR